MTRAVTGSDLAQAIRGRFPDAVDQWSGDVVWVKVDDILGVSSFLKDEPGFKFNYLNSITAVDYVDHFQMVYQLTSFEYNQSAVIKSNIQGREDLTVPSVITVWRGADFQEREVWDLMGIRFEGHPNHKRLMLWEGFPGHPLRKDFQDTRGAE